MATTPYHLRRYGIPEHTGTRKIWRAFLSFRNREKRKEFLSVAWCMQMAGALEEYGASAKEIERRSQRLMASMLGIDISTFNRRLAQFSAPDGRWDEDRRRRHAGKMKEVRALQILAGRSSLTDEPAQEQREEPSSLAPVPAKCRKQVRRLVTLFNKNAGFGQAQLYTLHMPQSLKPAMEKKDSKTKDAEMLARAFGAEWFDPERAGVNGFKPVPAWIWHPSLPDAEKCECQAGQMGLPIAASQKCSKCDGRSFRITGNSMPDYGRVLLTFLLLKGLEQYGSVEITQDEIAQALGMDVNTVAKYEDKLEALMIIRCIAGAVTRDQSGAVVDRKPHKIVWLPDRLLDEDIAQREYSRFQALRDRVGDREAYKRAEALHVALLKAWRGREHTLKAFWNELRRQFVAQGLDRTIADILLPAYRE